MQETGLAKYVGKELKNIIESLQVVQGTAKESGNTYYCIELTFINGYKKRIFLRNEEQFAWTNAIDLLETQVQLNF